MATDEASQSAAPKDDAPDSAPAPLADDDVATDA